MNFVTSRHLTAISFSLASLVLLISNSLHAQDLDNISISGRVLDQRGAAIAGAGISLKSDSTPITRSTITNSAGRYQLIQLPPGAYSLRVFIDAFGVQERNLTSVAGQHLQIDFTLFPQSLLVDPITINSEKTMALDTTRTDVGATITAQELNSLPIVSRSPLDFMFTLPGVSEEPLSTRDLAEDRNEIPANTPEEAGAFSLSGAPAYSNNVTIDGLDNNDDRAARERFQPSLEAVEEVQVITNQFSAEYGRASGGRVNIRTRSGTGVFRGRAFYSFRDEALNANSFRNNSLGLSRLPLQEHDAGFTLSGPLRIPPLKSVKRTFFFAAYEHDRTLDTALVDTLLPVDQSPKFPLPPPTLPIAHRLEAATAPALAADIAPFVSSVSTPVRNTIFTFKVDHQFNDLHYGTVMYSAGHLHNLRQFGGGNRLAEALQGKSRKSDAISYSDTRVFSARLVNQARMQYSNLAPALKAAGTTPVVLITINDPLMAGDQARRSGTVIAGSSTTGATDRSEARVQFQEILSIVHDAHSLKLGFDTQRIRSTFIDLSDASGTFNFASAGDFLAGVPSRFRQNFRTSSTQRNTYLGLFVQDEWRPRSNLTISYGIRYEHESIIDDTNNFGPRFSLAFDPFQSGKTVLRFGAGIFYNRVLLRTVDDFTLASQQLFFDTNALHDPVTGMLLTAEQRRAFIAANLRFPDVLQTGSPLVRTFGVLNRGFSRRLDPRLRIPEGYQANLGVERSLGAGFVLESSFTFTRGIHLWREFNFNAPRLPAGYANFSEYLASRDFPNFHAGRNGARPLLNTTSAGELVRFVFNAPNAANPNSVGTTVEFGVPVSVINLNSFNSATSVEVALAALNNLRPDPKLGEVEQLISAGNSVYHGLTIELRRQLASSESGFALSFRSAYTLSRLIDDGVVNTSDALTPADFRHERARSLMDRRHRFVFSGSFDLPGYLGSLRLASIWRITSGAPFNISIGGTDRNLDDVGNDRPSFTGDVRSLHWRSPGASIDRSVLDSFVLPTIGQSGNLPRNAGRGPGQFFLDVSVSRDIKVSNRVRIHNSVEFDNVLNKTVFSFGSEFINFASLAPNASLDQRQAFVDSFLVATRTQRPRQLRAGLRIEF